jgi:Ca2+-binding EF-hand superfamily protein
MLAKVRFVALGLLVAACANDDARDVEPRSQVDDTIELHVVRVFASHDTDRDGALSKAEAEAHPLLSSHFVAADIDADERLTTEEVMQLVRDVHESHCEAGDCSSEHPEDHVARAFERMDVDADDAVTENEAEGYPLAHIFSEADADSDGRVTRGELEAFAQRMHGEQPEGLRGDR